MKRVLFYLLFACIAFIPGAQAQLGIKAGINLANEIKSFSGEDLATGFSRENLTGYQIGLVYQIVPEKSGFGGDFGLLLSQKGYTFSDSISVIDVIREGYREINYLEAPFNLRYRLKVGFLGLFGYGGLYAGYALNGRTVVETENTTNPISFNEVMDRVDLGYNLGVGVEFFKKIQFGAAWSQGLKAAVPDPATSTDTSINRVFSVSLTYLF